MLDLCWAFGMSIQQERFSEHLQFDSNILEVPLPKLCAPVADCIYKLINYTVAPCTFRYLLTVFKAEAPSKMKHDIHVLLCNMCLLVLFEHICRSQEKQPSEVHTAHLGHPTVCDGKYTSAVTFEEDCGWCPRNFLHRHRLAFVDGNGQQVQVTENLPLDLQNALKELEPRDDGWSKEAWENFVKQST